MFSLKILSTLFFSVFVFLVAAGGAWADDAPVAVAQAVIGKVERLSQGESTRLQKGSSLFESDQLVTHQGGVVKIVFFDGSNVVIMEGSSLKIGEYYRKTEMKKISLRGVFEVVRGKARFFVKPQEEPRETIVRTANAILGIRGTTFAVDLVSPSETRVAVEHGKVLFQGTPSVPAVEVSAGQVSRLVGTDAAPVPPQPATVEELKAIQSFTEALPEVAKADAVPADLPLPSAPAPVPEKVVPGIKLEMPKVEEPKLDSPTLKTPKVETPKTESSEFESRELLGFTGRFLLGPSLFFHVSPDKDSARIYHQLELDGPSLSLQILGVRFNRDWQVALQVSSQGLKEPKPIGMPKKYVGSSRNYSHLALRGDKVFYSCDGDERPGCVVRFGLLATQNFLSLDKGGESLRAQGPGLGVEAAYESWWNRYLGYTVVWNALWGRFRSRDTADSSTKETRAYWIPNGVAATITGSFLYAGILFGAHF